MSYYKRFIPFLLALCICLTGCSTAPSISNSSKSTIPTEQTSDSNVSKTSRGALLDQKNTTPVKNATPASQDRKVVYTGELNGRVERVSKATDKVAKIAKDQEAYLTSSNSFQSDSGKTYRVTYRIPQAKLQPFLEQVKPLFLEEPALSLRASDVTEEYVDLESRQKAKEAVQNRLYDLMKQTKATSDLLTISQQLDQVETELEQIKGRKNYLNNQIAYSTLNIELTEKYTPGSSSNQPYSKELWSTLTGSWVQFFESLQVFLLVLVSLIPTLLFLVLTGFLVYWIWKKRMEKRRSMHKPIDSDKV